MAPSATLALLFALAPASGRQALPALRSGATELALRLRGGASSQYSYPSHRRPALLSPPAEAAMSDAERVYVAQQFQRPAVRANFLSRVYVTVLLQCVLTAIIVAALRGSPRLAYSLLPRSPAFFLLATVPALAIQWVPRLAETPPYGQLLLAAFTALTGVGLGAATVPLPTQMLLQAGVATSAAVGGLATYAITTKRDITASRGMLSAGLLALFALGVLQLLTGGGGWASSARAYLGALVFSGFLVYDTQLIAGGGRKHQLRPTQHVLGALMIFTDGLNLFLTILQAMARADRD